MSADGLFARAGGATFLNHAAAALIPEPVRAAMTATVDQMCTAARPDSLALADTLRGNLGGLINAEPGAIAITRSTAHGITILARGLRWRRGDNVVAVDGDYPAAIYPWMALRGQGVELRLVPPRPGGAIRPEDIAGRIDARTRVVCVSHVQFTSGYRLDAAAIGAECARQGVLFCVDVMQSAGAVEVDAAAMHAAAVVGGGHKWLLGPNSTAFCYLRPGLLETIPPLIPGALSVTDPFQFTDYRDRWAPDAHRFEETWLSAPSLAGLATAVDLAAETGIRRIEERVLAHTRDLSDALAAAGMTLAADWPRPAGQTAGIVSFCHPRVSSAQVLQALREAGVIASQRTQYVRLSPHYYNTSDDLARALQVVTALRPAP